MKSKAVILDRDGTIIIDKDYQYKKEELEFIPNSIKALQMLSDADYKLFIITNQSGIARGIFSEQQYESFNENFISVLKENNVKIEQIFFCPHHPDATIEKYKIKCNCRKPRTKFIKEIIGQYQIDIGHSFCIGDKTSDIKMGAAVGMKTILVKTGKAGMDNENNVCPSAIAKDLYNAVEIILSE